MKTKVLVLVMLFMTVIQVHSQEKKIIRIPLLGEVAPSFKAQSTNGQIAFPEDFGNKWKILFAHPKDFTPVCSSELLELSQQQEDYRNLDAQIVVLSTDIISQHNDWVKALEEIKYKDREPVKIKFPLVADDNLIISNQYGMIDPSSSISQNIRAVFIIDPKNKIRSITFYPKEVGRNMEEIKRTLVALQTIDDQKNLVTPANWIPGDNLMVPVITQAERERIGNADSDIHQVAWFMNFRKNK